MFVVTANLSRPTFESAYFQGSPYFLGNTVLFNNFLELGGYV